jgi:hypothetical protein
MAHQVFNLPPQQPLSAAGRVLPGAKLYSYLTGTSTPSSLYTTSALSVAHANPLIADAGGRFSTAYMDPSIVYKITVTDSTDVLLYTIDPANDQILSRAIIGSVLYPQTAGESGLTIVNAYYEPGWIDRYGTNTTPGTTNMATAVQAAFTSGHLVRGNRGTTYYCGSTTITVPGGTRASLYGVKLKSIVSGSAFLSVTGDDVEILGADIEGQGNGSLTTSAERLVQFVGSSSSAYKAKLTLRDCRIHESGFYGIYCEFAEDILVTNCRLNDIRHAAFGGQSVTRARVNYNVIHNIGTGSSGNSYGVFFSRTEGAGDLTSHPRPKDCEAIGNILYDITEWEALDTHVGERITFANNIIRNCKFGINASADSDDYTPQDIIISGNLIESDTLSSDPGRAIGSGGADSSNKARNIVVVGNTVRGYGAASNEDGAVMFQYTDGLVLSGNIIQDSRGSAICLLHDNDDFSVTGNVIRGVRSGVANAAALNIRNTTQTGHVAGNYFDATAQIGMVIAATNTGVTFGRNRIITSGTRIQDAVNGGEGLEIEGTATSDVASIADGDQAQFTITVAGAELGDYVVGIACSISTAALSLTGTVTAADTVTAVLQNNTGGAVDLANATYTALVRKR